MAEQPHHPPGTRRSLDVGIIIDDDVIILIHTKRLQGLSKETGRGHHMWHRVSLVGDGVDVETQRAGNVCGKKFGSGVALHSRQVAAGVKHTHRVKIGCEPVCGYDNGGHDQFSSHEGTGSSFSRRKAGFQTFDW